MYTLKCIDCSKEFPRSEYRKRGGGLHTNCKECRKKQTSERNKSRARMRQIKIKYLHGVKRAQVEITKKALTSEYLNATSVNRTRIRQMTEAPRKTKATLKALDRRTKIQQLWTEGLYELISRLDEGQQVPSLSEFMEGVKCTDA